MFMNHKKMVTCFRPFLWKKKFYRNIEILCFLCVLDPSDHFTKSCPVDETLTLKNFNSKWFLNHLTDPLQIWYDCNTTLRNFSDIFEIWIFLPKWVKKSCQSENRIIPCSYLRTYLTHILGTTQQTHLMTQVPMKLTKGQDHRSRSNKKNWPKS